MEPTGGRQMLRWEWRDQGTNRRWERECFSQEVGTRVLQPSCSVRSIAAGGGKSTDSCWWREKTTGEAYGFLPRQEKTAGNASDSCQWREKSAASFPSAPSAYAGFRWRLGLFYGMLLVGPTWATSLFPNAGRGTLGHSLSIFAAWISFSVGTG